MLSTTRETARVLNTAIDVTTMSATCAQIMDLAHERRPSYICFATAHMLVEATRDPEIHESYQMADMVNPDGVPIAWALRMLGFRDAECVSGPMLFPRLLRLAAENGLSVGFYGGREETLQRISSRIRLEIPDLEISYVHSPPFRPLTRDEQKKDLELIKQSGTKILFVGLGSPKQELWMRRWAAEVPCVSLGVGAAFEFFSGEKTLPPFWIQRFGLNWLIRLCQEPRRLFRRNLASPIFAWLALQQVIQHLFRSGRINAFPITARVARSLPTVNRGVPAVDVAEESNHDHEHLEIAQ
jgi:N-acetylglucosaminyldiphosphoundecaprenol N-acetyl-beta-D-mannosaminyltransferase